MSKMPVEKLRKPNEAMIDEAVDESFPASDPPAVGRKERAGSPHKRQTDQDKVLDQAERQQTEPGREAEWNKT
jgi:hypothetical protein